MLSFILFGLVVYLLVQLIQKRKELNRQKAITEQQLKQVTNLLLEVESLSPYKEIRDIALELIRIKAESEAVVTAAKLKADDILKQAALEAKSKQDQSDNILRAASEEANRIIQQAKEKAEQIAGDAYRALKESEKLADTIKAMKNVINGYGDQYIKPTFSFLDEMAEQYAFTDAGAELRKARDRSKLMVTTGRAATCDYVEKNRSETAIRFVADAFNGKVDSILSRAKTENYGVLEQQIKDAFALTNLNGQAFRNAVITNEYLSARIEELHWLVAVNLIKEQEREEQRLIREQIREEEKARREYEKARKEAEKEELAVQKAMEKMQALLEKATGDQRLEYEAKMAKLNEKLAEAEAKSQRAISMAQQTRTGHVYIISNIGSFGENIFKVGMTRRLEPIDRIKELGDASVPFSFDVHAMIWSEDAPALEKMLHHKFLTQQVNKVNPRKEFFKVSLSEIKAQVDNLGLEASWTLAAQAAEYRESLEIERRLADRPDVAEEWVRHQLEFEPELVIEEVDGE